MAAILAEPAPSRGRAPARTGGRVRFVADDDRLRELANLLFAAARNGDVPLLAEAMEGGAPPDLTNQNGDTLVMLAAYHGHARAVQVLLDAGAQPDLLNDRGQTPLAGATFKGFTEVVETLLAAGADPYAGSPPAFTTALMFQRDDLVELFDAAARRTTQDKGGEPT
jgi:ankyrin repeat protein